MIDDVYTCRRFHWPTTEVYPPLMIAAQVLPLADLALCTVVHGTCVMHIDSTVVRRRQYRHRRSSVFIVTRLVVFVTTVAITIRCH